MGIFWTPGDGVKPWWVPPPINMDFNPMMKVDFDKAKVASNQQPPKMNDNKEDLEAWNQKQLLHQQIKCWNADFIKDLPEEQQWAFVNTMSSIQSSMVRLSNGAWGQNHSICGAVYGQNQAKIQIISRLLGDEYADKLQTALDWFFDRTVGQEQPSKSNPKFFKPISKNNEAFIKFEKPFQQLGSIKDATVYKQHSKNALEELISSVGDEYYYTYKAPVSENWFNYARFLINDMDTYFKALASHGFKGFFDYLHEIDITA